MTIQQTKTLLGLGFILLSGAALAEPANFSWVATVSGGAAFVTQPAQNQTLTLTQDNKTVTNYYTPQSSQNLTGMAGVFIGVEKNFSMVAWQIGFGYYYLLPFDVKGTASYPLNNVVAQSHYQYKVQSQQLLVESKLLLPLAKRWYPYVMVGVGPALNRSSDYSETPFNGDNSGNYVFGDQQTIAFSYSVGAGLDVALTDAWRLGIGYRFSDLGAVGLGKPTNQTADVTLNQNHLYAQSVLLQLSYVF